MLTSTLMYPLPIIPLGNKALANGNPMTTERIVSCPFQSGHIEAKRLILFTLLAASQNPDDDSLLDMLFEDPDQLAQQLSGVAEIRLSEKDREALRQLGTKGLTTNFNTHGGTQAVKALVACLERLDMPEVSNRP